MIQRLVIGALLFSSPALAQRLAFDASGVELRGDDTEVVTHRGQTALAMRTGAAVWEDVRFEDGTIEFDVETVGVRSFVYIVFRMESTGEYEDLYFRAHKSKHPDFIQYSPVYRGESNWQLYHDERYTAAAPMPANEWVHIKVVVSGPQAAVFVGETDAPQLVIPLARDPQPGFVALRSNVPAGPEFEGPATHFANFELKPGEVDFDFSDPPRPEVPVGLVTEWQVSDTFEAPEGAVTSYKEPKAWTPVSADDSGLLVLLKHVSRPDGVRRSSVFAKVDLRAQGARTAQLDLGYSDEVSVFLNGRLLFSADDSYVFNLPRRQGLIGLGQSTFYLPLEDGDNEVVLAVTDRFGGWGLMGRVNPSDGVTVVAPR